MDDEEGIVISTTGRAGLKAALYARRKQMGRAARGRPKKPTRWLYPWATERRYGAAIRSWLKPLQNYIHEYLKNNQEAILRGDSAILTRQDNIPGGTYRRMVRSLNGWFTTYFPPLNESGTRDAPPIVMAGLGQIAESMNDFNAKQWDKAAKAELGIEFPVYEQWWPETKQAWQEENYTLIQSLCGDYIKRVNMAAGRAVTSGLSPATLMKQIMKIDKNISAARANLIARDQIGKLNGQITQARMEAVGLALYEWSTSMDERVRDSHYELEGMICRWDDSTVYSDDGGKTWKPRPSDWCQLHPGQDIQCRCTALSYWDELVDEVDQDIDSEEGFISGPDDESVEAPKTTSELDEVPEHGRRTPLIESQLDIEQGKPANIRQANRDSNINFTLGTAYKNNCQRSIVAYELQRRGYRVTAMPAILPRKNDIINSGFECFIGSGRKLQMIRVPEGGEELLKILSKSKEGARFAIVQNWGTKSGGHTYIAEKLHKKIQFFDPQRDQSYVNYLGNIRKTDGKADLFYYRIDDAFLSPKIDFTKIVKPFTPKGKIDKADSFDVSSREDKKMTKDEAKAIIEKSEELASWTDSDGVTYHTKLGDFYEELSDGFGFIVYPYTSNEPLNPLHAFVCYVQKDSGLVIWSDAPLDENELKKLGGK